MKCTVLGGRGFVGGHLVRHLESSGFEVHVPPREIVSSLSGALGHVFYCIGLTADFRSRPFETVDAHVTTLASILQRADFESLTYLSSTRVYARSVKTEEDVQIGVCSQDVSDLYNLSKLLGESLCVACDRPKVRIVRLSNVIGPGMGDENFVGALIREAKVGHIRLRTDLNSAKDYVAIDDATMLLRNIAFSGREKIYNVAAGVQVSNGQLTDELCKFYGCTLEIDADAPSFRFPQVNIQKITSEFAFNPSDAIDTLVKTLRL